MSQQPISGPRSHAPIHEELEAIGKSAPAGTWDRSEGLIRTCDAGHSSLEAANWQCPWCLLAQEQKAVIEMCAKVCDAYAVGPMGKEQWITAIECAQRIRALATPTQTGEPK